MEDAPVHLFIATRHDIASKIDKIMPPILDWSVQVLPKIFIQGSNVVLKWVILPGLSD
jgi:hypothetical protein